MNRAPLGTQTMHTQPRMLCAALLSLALVCLNGCQGTVPLPDEQQGRTVADKFLEQIRTGQAGQAWDSTSAEFKSAEGRETFVRNCKKRPWLTKPVSFVSVQEVTVQNSPRAEYQYRSADGKSNVALLLALEGETWRVDRMKVN